MIFGKTDRERWDAQAAESTRLALGLQKFAWFPQRLFDGRRVWLRAYWVYHGRITTHVDWDKNGKSFRTERGSIGAYDTIRRYLEAKDEYVWRN